jgi:hypothetical protein
VTGTRPDSYFILSDFRFLKGKKRKGIYVYSGGRLIEEEEEVICKPVSTPQFCFLDTE